MIERGRMVGGREGVVAVAFGPGVTVEMVLMRRTGWKGRMVEEGRVDTDLEDMSIKETEVVGGRDLEKKVEGIVEDAKADRIGEQPPGVGGVGLNGNGLTNGNGSEDHIKMEANKVSGKSNGIPENLKTGRSVSEVGAGRCVCIAPSLRFGGSGLDCWCRS